LQQIFLYPNKGLKIFLLAQKNGKFTLMNSSINWGWNTVFNKPQTVLVLDLLRPDGHYHNDGDRSGYNGDLGYQATHTKFKDYDDPSPETITVFDPVNVVRCPTCDGTFRIAVAFLCWFNTVEENARLKTIL
jgi:hypothetical protein